MAHVEKVLILVGMFFGSSSIELLGCHQLALLDISCPHGPDADTLHLSKSLVWQQGQIRLAIDVGGFSL